MGGPKKNKKKSRRFEYQNLMKIIAGVDEVGRGSLVGPVYAAAVILKSSINTKLLKSYRGKKSELNLNKFIIYLKNFVFLKCLFLELNFQFLTFEFCQFLLLRLLLMRMFQLVCCF